MHEANPATGNQEPSRDSSQLVRFPERADGSVLLARSYSAEGTVINEWGESDQRKAIIRAGEHDEALFYLRNNTIFDINHLEDPDTLSSFDLKEMPMWDVVVGKSAHFTKLNVTEVIKTEGVLHPSSEDDKRILDGATPAQEDIFAALDNLVERQITNVRRLSPRATARRRDLPYLGPVSFELEQHSETWQLRDDRLGVTNEKETVRQKDAELDLIRSREGVVMSPQPKVIVDKDGNPTDERDTVDYNPRISTHIGQVIGDAKHRATQKTFGNARPHLVRDDPEAKQYGFQGNEKASKVRGKFKGWHKKYFADRKF